MIHGPIDTTAGGPVPSTYGAASVISLTVHSAALTIGAAITGLSHKAVTRRPGRTSSAGSIVSSPATHVVAGTSMANVNRPSGVILRRAAFTSVTSSSSSAGANAPWLGTRSSPAL